MKLFVIVVSIFLLPIGVRAAVFGSLRGVIHDPSHRPVQGASVAGRVIVKGQWVGSALWFQISLDDKVLGEARVWSGCDLPFQTTPGSHTLKVVYGLLGYRKTKLYQITLHKGVNCRIALKLTKGGDFPDSAEVQMLPGPPPL